MKKLTASILSAMLMLSMVFSSSVFAANDATQASAWDSFVGLFTKATTSETMGVEYAGWVQDVGQTPTDGTYITGPNQLGTPGLSRRLEGVQIKLDGAVPTGASIKYIVHVEDYGWMGDVNDTTTWKANGIYAGTKDESKRIEDIKIVLVGADGKTLPGYSVSYAGHVENEGDLAWVSDGASFGNTGKSQRLECLKVKVVQTKADMTAYTAAVAQAGTAKAADYTTASYKVLTDAVAANVVTDADTQVKVDAAAKAINDAYAALVPGTDLTAYNAAVTKANAVVKADYTDASYAALTKALADNVVTKDDTAAQVKTATDAITAATDALVKVANMDSYNEAVTKANAAVKADYTADSYAALQTALTSNVVTNQDTQAKVDEATAAINGAYDALIKVWKIDTVKGVTNTVVDVTLTEAASVADINAAVIKNAAGTVVKINDAVLSADGKLITVYTDAQETGKSYTLTSGAISKTYVAGVADTTAPTSVTAVSKSNTVVEVTFTDANRLEVASATNVANYTIPGLTVTGAAISTDAATNGKVVVLTTTAQTAGTVYTVSVLNVADIARNAITTALTSSFAGKAADKDPISAVTATSYSNTQVIVRFTDASNVDPSTATTLANYTIAGLAPTAVKFIATADDVAAYSLNAADVNKTVVLTTPSQTAGTVYTLSVNGVADVVGNVMTVAKTSTFAGKAADKTAPTLTSALPYNNTKVVVNFNENLDPTSAANVANYTIAGLTPTAAQLITTATDVATYGSGSTAYKSVVLTTPAQTAGTVYTLSVLGVADVNGNAITTAKTATFAGKGVDTVKPVITSVTAKAGNLVDVVFSKALDKASAETLTNYSISTLGYPVSATYNSTTKTVTLSTATQTNGTIYTMTVNGVADTSGNVIVADTQKTFAGIGTAQDAPALSSVTALDNSRIKVVFNKAVTGGSGPLAIGDFTLYKGTTDTTLSGNTGVSLTATNTAGTEYIIYVGTPAGDKLTSDVYTLKVASTVKDLGGNVIGSTDATKYQKTFGGVEAAPTAPSIASITQTGAATVVATFDQPMTSTALSAVGDITATYTKGTLVTKSMKTTTSAVVDTKDKTKVTFTFDNAFDADQVATLNIKSAALPKLTDITGKVGMTANNTTTGNYEVQFGTLSFGTDALTLTSATGVDDMTLELAFSEDITFNGGNVLSSIGVSDNFMVITKASDNSTVTNTFKYAEQTASNKVRVYFNSSAMTEGTVYKLAITAGANGANLFTKATDGTAITAANGIQTFGYNATVNEGPKLVSVVPLSGTVVQLTFSEPLSGNPAQTTNLVFKNGANTFAATSIGLTDVSGDKTIYTATVTEGVFLSGTTYTVQVVTGGLTDKYGIKNLVATDGTTVPHLTFGGAGDLATTLALPVAGATNQATDLLMTFGTKLYAPSAGTMTELTAVDQQAKFTLTGVTAASGTYASAKTVTWATIAGAATGDTIAVTADSIYDAAGNSLAPANFTVVYNGTSWDKQ